MKAVTLRQPWAAAAVHFGMDLDNRKQATDYRGLLAIHAGTRRPRARDMEELAELIAARADVTPQQVLAATGAESAVIAVGRLTGVCGPQDGPCGCGPWALRGAAHLRLEGVRALPEPVEVVAAAGGRHYLWVLPYGAEKAVRAQLAALPIPESAGIADA